MRISLNTQITKFLLKCKKDNTWVFLKGDIKTTIKDQLTINGLMFSPYDNIYVLKKSTQSIDAAIKDHLYIILQKFSGTISGDFIPNYYLGKKKENKDFIIYKDGINWKTQIGERKKINITIKKSNIYREFSVIKYQGATLNIESPLSYIVNNIKKEEKKAVFIEFVLTQGFDTYDINVGLLHKYKLSGLSKLAIFYKNYGREPQYLIIKRAIEEGGRKLDRRASKVKIEFLKKPQVKMLVNDYDNILS